MVILPIDERDANVVSTAHGEAEFKTGESGAENENMRWLFGLSFHDTRGWREKKGDLTL